MEIYDLPNNEFKTATLRKLNELPKQNKTKIQ